jgi:MarR family transcriptional regulator, organic hydroperoxide resistance regulator
MMAVEIKDDIRKEIEYSLDEIVGYMLSSADLCMKPFVELCLRTEGVSYGMRFFLHVLWEQEGLTQKELSYLTGFSQPTSFKVLRDMKSRGLIQMVNDPKNSRRLIVNLTQLGRDIKGRVLPKLAKLNKTALAGIPETDVIVMRKVLQKIRSNMDRQSPRETIDEL